MLDNASNCMDRCKQPAMQAATAPYLIQALIMPVLRQAIWLNEVGLDLLRL
jgi:hypothetical protein